LKKRAIKYYTRRKDSKESCMKELVVVIAIVVAWYVLSRYVLPRFGIKT
jgi:hypothetical protein